MSWCEARGVHQASGYLRHGLRPVSGADLGAFDRRRLRDYCSRVLGADLPHDDDRNGWERLLTNLELMTESGGVHVATVDGLLLFGRTPTRYLSQAGVRAVCYAGTEPEYATRADEVLHGPMVPLRFGKDGPIENGLVEQVWDFVRRNTMPTARLEGARRIDGWEFPEAVLREVLVNALVHRDYSIAGTDVAVAIYADRMEVESPGGLPNTVTVERMKAGVRYARNQTLVNVMRDYGYLDARGMGVRMKMIPGMRAHNGTEPDLVAEEHRFTVRLWKTATQGGSADREERRWATSPVSLYGDGRAGSRVGERWFPHRALCGAGPCGPCHLAPESAELDSVGLQEGRGRRQGTEARCARNGLRRTRPDCCWPTVPTVLDGGTVDEERTQGSRGSTCRLSASLVANRGCIPSPGGSAGKRARLDQGTHVHVARSATCAGGRRQP